MDTIEYATFRYGTIEVENGLYARVALTAPTSSTDFMFKFVAFSQEVYDFV